MRNKYRVPVVVALVSILLMNPALLAWGNPVPGRWEKVAETKPGQEMIVYTKDGAKNKYVYRSLDSQVLHCVNQYGGDVQIELANINKIVLPQAEKYAKEWALWGAVGGAVGGAIFPAATNLSGFDHTTGGYLAFAGIGAILGALGGGITGAAVGASGETIYISKELAMKEASK